MPVIRVSKDGSIPLVDVQVGFGQLGEYNVTLWDKNGKNPQTVNSGNTVDDILDNFRLVRTRGELAKLDGRKLTVVIWVKALNRSPGAQWSYDFSVTQDGADLTSKSDKGSFNKPFYSAFLEYDITLV